MKKRRSQSVPEGYPDRLDGLLKILKCSFYHFGSHIGYIEKGPPVHHSICLIRNQVLSSSGKVLTQVGVDDVSGDDVRALVRREEDLQGADIVSMSTPP